MRGMNRSIACLAAAVGLAAPLAGQSDVTSATPRTLAEVRAVERRVREILPRLLDATVAVPGASGVVIEGGYVLTASHVSRGLPDVATCQLHDGREFEAERLGRQTRADGAVMRIRGAAIAGAPMGRSATLEPGQWCVMLGHPGGRKTFRPASVRIGRVLAVTGDTIVTDCPMSAGDSGGPLFDLNGRVIGLNKSITGNLTTNNHAPIDTLRDAWDDLVAGDRVDARRGRAWVPKSEATRGAPAMLDALGAATSGARRSTAEILGEDGARVALATVVHPDGYLVTKASEVRGTITCRLAGDATPVPARVVATDPGDDLALVRVERTNLTPITWADGEPAPVGSFVIVPGLDARPEAFGIIGIPNYTRDRRPQLGVEFRFRRNRVQIRRVLPGGAAEAAGLQADDVIESIDGTPVERSRDLGALIRARKPGDTVELVVRTGETRRTVRADLGFVRAERQPRQARLWGPMSDVRRGFSRVLQHDAVIEPAQCGGPLVDLDGRAIALNIARAGRVESLALPGKTVRRALIGLFERAGVTPPPRREVRGDGPYMPEATPFGAASGSRGRATQRTETAIVLPKSRLPGRLVLTALAAA